MPLYFQYGFIIISILLIAVILLQQKSSSLGGMMGQDAGEKLAQTRRGSDQVLFQATIVLATLFMAGGLYAMFG